MRKKLKTTIDNLRELSTSARFKREDAVSGCQPCFTAVFPRQERKGRRDHPKSLGERKVK